MNSFEGKVAVVTGGAYGIGKAIADSAKIRHYELVIAWSDGEDDLSSAGRKMIHGGKHNAGINQAFFQERFDPYVVHPDRINSLVDECCV
jgi:NAD(P)-dependent dehydrogenase (short-subunit alcohol dehydrogenase family)